MAKTLYYNPVTEEMEFVNNPSPLRENLGERFGLNEGGRINMKPGGIVEPGVTNYATSEVKTEQFKYPIKNQFGTVWSDKAAQGGSKSWSTPEFIKYVKENFLKVSTKKMAETMFPDEKETTGSERVRKTANELGFDVGAKRNIGQLALKEEPWKPTTSNRKAIQKFLKGKKTIEYKTLREFFLKLGFKNPWKNIYTIKINTPLLDNIEITKPETAPKELRAILIKASKESEKYKTEGYSKIAAAREKLVTELNNVVKAMSKKELFSFVNKNSTIREMVETSLKDGEFFKGDFTKMTEKQIRDKLFFEADHIKPILKGEIDPITKQVLKGLDIHYPENLRISIKAINNSLKHNATKFLEKYNTSTDPNIIKKVKNIKNYFTGKGQGLLIGDYIKGEVVGGGEIAFPKQLTNIGIKFDEFFSKMSAAKRAEIAELIGQDLTKIAPEALASRILKKPLWLLTKVIGPTAMPGVQALWETGKAIITGKLPDMPDVTSPMTWMTPAFWEWGVSTWGFDKTLKNFGKTFKHLSKGDKARLIRNVVARAGLKPHHLLKIRNFSVPWLAATAVGKAFTESQTGVFRDEKTGELKMEEEQVTTLLPNMIKDYHWRHESDEFFEKEYGIKKEEYKSELPEFLDLEAQKRKSGEGMDYAQGGLTGVNRYSQLIK